jgi:hypothetical protein
MQHSRVPLSDYSEIHIGAWPPRFLVFGAASLLPFVRRNVGECALRPGLVITMTVMLILIALFGALVTNGSPGVSALILFALLYLFTSLVLWMQRRRGLASGEEIHSLSFGQSRIAGCVMLPLPVIEIVVTPALILGLGYVLLHTPLAVFGCWLIYSGISLAMLGVWEHLQRRARHRGLVDNMIFARAQEDHLRTYERGGFRAAQGAASASEQEFAADPFRRTGS